MKARQKTKDKRHKTAVGSRQSAVGSRQSAVGEDSYRELKTVNSLADGFYLLKNQPE
jgi:hypothetical protein